MRVALYNLTTTTQFGGVETFVWEIARSLQARGHQVTIVGGQGSFVRSIPGVHVVQFSFVSRGRLRAIPGFRKAYAVTKLIERLTFGLRAFEFMRRSRFDIIQIEKPYDLPVVALLKSLGAGRIVLGSQGKDFYQGDRLFAGCLDASVSCSAFNADQVQARYGFRPRVIYNGVDPDQFRPGPVDPASRRSLAGDGSLILYSGRLVEWKGIQYLIRAVACLAPRRDVRLVVAGAGDYRPQLERLAEELGVADRVTFAGFLTPEQLKQYYLASYVVCQPSYANETFAISMAEAMACGRPVVGSNFGGIPEVISDGETGVLARPRDEVDLAGKIECLLQEPQLCARMGEAGRRRVLELFSWDKVAERLDEVYHELV